eukprot:2339607-Prorocentrum_lima.AAC.1
MPTSASGLHPPAQHKRTPMPTGPPAPLAPGATFPGRYNTDAATTPAAAGSAPDSSARPSTDTGTTNR